MFSKRENLLIRPWEKQRYNNHRRKIESALPAIDARPPPTYSHVNLKLKKLQREKERCEKIGKDNVQLLQRLGAIMKVNRLDNNWRNDPPLPDFLQREGVYWFPPEDGRFETGDSRNISSVSSRKPSGNNNLPDVYNQYCPRYVRCSACNPSQGTFSEKLPAPRVPWATPPRSVSQKNMRRSITCRNCSRIIA